MSEITKEMIEELVAKGHSKIEMTKILDRSMDTINMLLKRYGISMRAKRQRIRVEGKNPCAWKHCTNTTNTVFCSKTCKNKDAVTSYRATLIKRCIVYKGGSCRHCGYDRYTGALHFHHLDPSQKDFSLRGSGNTFKWDTIVSELDKCILLCGNCHAEYHAGLLDLVTAMETNPTPEEGMQHLAEKGLIPKKPTPKRITRCIVCQVVCSAGSTMCWTCTNKHRVRPKKIQWPDLAVLIELLKNQSFTEVGRTLGISDNALRKHLRKNGVDPKTLGSTP